MLQARASIPRVDFCSFKSPRSKKESWHESAQALSGDSSDPCERHAWNWSETQIEALKVSVIQARGRMAVLVHALPQARQPSSQPSRLSSLEKTSMNLVQWTTLEKDTIRRRRFPILPYLTDPCSPAWHKGSEEENPYIACQVRMKKFQFIYRGFITISSVILELCGFMCSTCVLWPE